MLKYDKPLKRYSESFKLKILAELEQGKYTKSELMKVYGIGSGTITDWIKKYGRFDLLNKHIKIQTVSEKDRVKSLENEIKKLKELLVKKDLNNLVNEAYLEYTAKQLGYKSVDELKKKLDLE